MGKRVTEKEHFLIEFYRHSMVAGIASCTYTGSIQRLHDTIRYTNNPLCEMVIDQHIDIPTMCSQSAMDIAHQVDEALIPIFAIAASNDNRGCMAGAGSRSIDLGDKGFAREVEPQKIIRQILMSSCVLDEQNVTRMGRWFVLPDFAVSAIRLSGFPNILSANDRLVNGNRGEIDDFVIYGVEGMSATQKECHCPFGQKGALFFAAALEEVCSGKWRLIYGCKVLDARRLGCLVIKGNSMGGEFCDGSTRKNG